MKNLPIKLFILNVQALKEGMGHLTNVTYNRKALGHAKVQLKLLMRFNQGETILSALACIILKGEHLVFTIFKPPHPPPKKKKEKKKEK